MADEVKCIIYIYFVILKLSNFTCMSMYQPKHNLWSYVEIQKTKQLNVLHVPNKKVCMLKLILKFKKVWILLI